MAPGNLPGDNRAFQIQVPCALFFVLTTSVVALRLWARIKLRSWSGIGWDDGTVLASWLFATIVSALMMAACSYGFGQHISNLSNSNKLTTLKLFYVAQAFYKLTINLTKASILLLYLCIFVKRLFRVACYALLAIVLAYMVATFASSVWQCTPIPRAWDKSIPGTCISISANWHANAGFSIATDVLILALPMYPIYTSMLPGGQKVALIVVFALGLFFPTVLTISPVAPRSPASSTELTSHVPTDDIDSSIWTMVEQNLAIICACLPVCRLPLAYAFPAYFSGSSSANYSAASSSAGNDASNTKPDHSHDSCQIHRSPVSHTSRPHAPSAYAYDKQHEKAVADMPLARLSAKLTAGWKEADPESGRYILSHVSSCGTTQDPGSYGIQADDVELQGGGQPDAHVIRMIKRYSITYEDGKPSGN
ncbi:hypothetical protein B0H66DRAFT_579121 [Apodospora peruviana]|uniref:Rhodopsin domain-containing protein n=1 Tax=Apodospora peruviana TaxID=516989 RepID=A0AAE0MEB0_9PEZI|nr:hypothetical protein B0H66DRAFT_579121 [Apodospora peruviana]